MKFAQYKLKWNWFFGFILSLIIISSCKKLVTVPAPTNSLVTTSVFNNDATAIAAQLAVYAQLEGTSYSFDYYSGLSSDELTYNSTSAVQLDIYHNNLNAAEGANIAFWANFYKLIYDENAILENVQASTGMSAPVKKQATGEALFMRAYLYFQLVNFYGDVPFVTSTDYTKNSTLPRSATSLVYQQIIDDLKTAQPLLSSSYVDASDTPLATPDKVRPTSWAADALLARVYLYTGDYKDAIIQASLVINSGNYSLENNLNSVFLMNSNEAIWQLTPPTGTLYTNEGDYFVLTKLPASSIGKLTASPQLLVAFEANDKRRINWIGSYTSGGNTYYFPNKYKATNTATSLTEYSMVFRLAELYLIRSEAEANNSDASDAVNDLNMIRRRAGLPGYNVAVNGPLLTAIMHERQVELFTEEHRWFDLKRTKTVYQVMGSPGNVTQAKGGSTWNSFQQLYPLNVNDLTFNPALVQNPGY